MADEKPREQWLKSRKISERVIVEGDLALETPTSLSNGDADGDTDISLLTDPFEGRALLTGTSIAGALRNYLRERLLSYEQEEFINEKGERKKKKDKEGKVLTDEKDEPINEDLPDVTRLFGSLEDDGEQSLLIVEDAFYPPLEQQAVKPSTELRDGVRIDGKTRTAYVDERGRGAKFDSELLEAGTKFPLRFELLIPNYSGAPTREDLIDTLTAALQGFEDGEIHLGGRKRRGYGQCRVKSWTVKRYDLKKKNGLLAWLSSDLARSTDAPKEIKDLAKPTATDIKTKIAQAVKTACALTTEPRLEDRRSYFKLTAKFALDGSLLIRSGSELSQGAQPDAVHLRSKRNGNLKPIVSGTSLAGVLRHRAMRIVKTIGGDESLVEKIFGADMEELKDRNNKRREEAKKSGKPEPEEQPFASRLEVAEREVIEKAMVEGKEVAVTNALVQTRIRIDRFTGGAYESALFNAAPVFAADKTHEALEICLKLRSPQEGEIGLLLLLLKDLWTRDLPIGGESSIGRGRLKGLSATLELHGADSWSVTLRENPDGAIELINTNPADKVNHAFLNSLVDKLNGK